MDKSQIEALLARIEVWLLIFGVIVVVGVAGESFFGVRHWWNSRKLQTIQKAEAREQEEAIAKLNQESAALREKAEAERLARVKLEKAVSPRRLTGEQKEKLAGLLKQYSDPVGVVIVSAMLDTESTDLADDFDSSIHDGAKWKTLRVKNRLTSETGISLGVLTGTPELDPWKRPIAELKARIGKALTAIGVKYRDVIFGERDVNSTDPEFKLGIIYLVIEHKPPIKIETAAAKNSH